MIDNHFYFLAMNSYLARADGHYLDGRSLWLNNAIDGACNLLWLSIEQMMKLIIIQERIIEGTLQPVIIKEDNLKKTLAYSAQGSDIRSIHKILDKTSYNINSKHQLDELLKILKTETGIDLSDFIFTLKKVKEYYERRYYKDEGSSIDLNELENIDKIFFLLRDKISEKIHRSLIDEIGYQKKFTTGHPLRFFGYAYLHNNHFRVRKHPLVYQQLPNGKIIKNDGVLDEVTETVPPMIPLHNPIRTLDT